MSHAPAHRGHPLEHQEDEGPRNSWAPFPPYVWKLRSLVSGTAVMLGVTGILVGTVFLASVFMQTVMGFSALRTGLAFLPFALAITAGTVVARHLLADVTLHAITAAGLVGLGLGVGTVFVPVSVTSMMGIPDSHAGVASGFLMTGHEIGAALGVAVLSAVASTAGSVATHDGAVHGFSRGLVGAAVCAGVVAVFALVRMPAPRAAAGVGVHLH